jgi:hypothetical protein
MNIIELQKQIFAFLKTKATRVYYEDAPDNAQYPYVVYDFPSSLENFSNREDFILEIDIWDNATDTKPLETLTGNIDGDGNVDVPSGLHRKNFYVSGKLSAKVYKEGRYNIRDEDKRIKHRQLRYRIQTYL